jgi:hypothetical protein
LLDGSLSVHRSAEPWRLPAYLRAIADGHLPGGYAADDGSALLFAGGRLLKCVASQPGRSVVRVKLVDGQPAQLRMPVRVLQAVSGHSAIGRFSTPGAESERQAIEELRSIRATVTARRISDW